MVKEKRLGIADGERPEAKIIGEDGNIFNVMGIASRSLKKAGFKEESEEMVNRVTSSHSYDEALGIIMEYIEPVGSDWEVEEDYSMEMEGY